MTVAKSIRVRGVVQGVGFRPFVFRLAQANSLAGWVLNEEDGVGIHLEGAEPAVDAFLADLAVQTPPAARITAIDVDESQAVGLTDFTIRHSERNGRPSVAVSPDLPVCDECLRELFDAGDRRYGYPYINCTNCGPRYSVIERLPYDRANTTMKPWQLDEFCAAQYHDAADRRFHAQPVACAACGPQYYLEPTRPGDPIDVAAGLLREGHIVAVKGIGGYHLVCDAGNPDAVRALRERKFRKEKPFAVMAAKLDVARSIVELSPEAEALLSSSVRPIVLARRRREFEGLAPDNDELGVMLPYAPLHHLLFAAGAPEVLVMTSANRSSEPIAYEDQHARESLAGIADAFLIGERPIARRVDDSVARAGVYGPVVLRRSRGLAPGAVTRIPASQPILALGADLKNAITLVVEGQAFVSQHIGDLDHYESLRAFQQTIQDLLGMYDVDREHLIVAHDAHPQYASTQHALEFSCARKYPIQHHRAHVASVLAERQAWEKRVVGISFDGTGFGDDGKIWGGEFFVGSIAAGFERSLHLRRAGLSGGDAAARFPVQCAGGFVFELYNAADFTMPPFDFGWRYRAATQLLKHGVRAYTTTSMGRLFDTVAALLGFTREISFEGQAAMWLEHLADSAADCEAYPFPILDGELDWRPLLMRVVKDRLAERPVAEIARAFHASVAQGLCRAAMMLCEAHRMDTIVLSGGVFQNELLLRCVQPLLAGVTVWTNSVVPPNDGGISLGQAALAAFHA